MQAREQRADRPANDADAVDALRAEAVEQAARGQLRECVGPAKSGEEVARGCRASRWRSRLMRHAGNGEHHAIAIAEGAGDEQHEHDQVADVGCCSTACGLVHALVPSCDEFLQFLEFARVEFGERRADRAGARPMAFMPAFTMDTA